MKEETWEPKKKEIRKAEERMFFTGPWIEERRRGVTLVVHRAGIAFKGGSEIEDRTGTINQPGTNQAGGLAPSEGEAEDKEI